MIYDGVDLTPYLKVEKVKRPLMAPVALDTKEVNAVDGSIIQNVRLEPKTIEVDVRLIAPISRVERQKWELRRLRRDLSYKLFRRQKCKLVLNDEPDLYEMAIIDGATDLDAFCYSRFATLTWHCDPASYGKWRTKTSGGGTLSTYVNGTYQTAPVVNVNAKGPFTCYFDGQPFQVTASTTGTVVIDSETHTTTHNNQRVGVSIYSDYPTWQPGKHTITCDYPFTVGFQERWL